ncbi:MAG: hypothetical protein M0Z52_05880 [Actinomycetota bacterium]|nr:hypothetical protein [Actinomycetota bacterium]
MVCPKTISRKETIKPMGFIESFVALLKKQDLLVNCRGNDRFEIWNIGNNKEIGFVKFDAFRNSISFSGDLINYRPSEKDTLKNLILASYKKARLAYPE